MTYMIRVLATRYSLEERGQMVCQDNSSQIELLAAKMNKFHVSSGKTNKKVTFMFLSKHYSRVILPQTILHKLESSAENAFVIGTNIKKPVSQTKRCFLKALQSCVQCATINYYTMAHFGRLRSFILN